MSLKTRDIKVMPQASKELHDYWGGADDAPVIAYLEGVGFKLTRKWTWIKPSPDYILTEKDWKAIQFMVDEWDYGGLEE